MEPVVGGKFKMRLGQKIGSGAFSDIFLGIFYLYFLL